MVLKSQKSIVRKYYFRCILILICYMAIVVPCKWVFPNIWYLVFCIALYFPVKVIIRIVANKTITSVLFTKLDAIGFQELIKDKNLLPSLEYRINAALFTGDYQTTVNIATYQIQKKKSSIRVKYLYLCILALTYFELRDFKKLQILLKKYDDYKENYPSKSFLNLSNSLWSYYRYFLEQNYEACKIVCKERNLGFSPNAWDIKLRKLQNDFFYAIACYENGEFEEAKSLFENIISIAPNINYANLSQKYLMAIEQNQQISSCDIDVLPDVTYQIYDIKSEKRFKKFKWLKRIGVVMIIVSLVAICLLDVNNNYSDSTDEIFSTSTYIMPPEACVKLFKKTPQEFAKSPTVYWTDKFCIRAEVDKSGNLLIILNEKQEELWRSAFPVPTNVEKFQNLASNGIYISFDYSEVTVKCKKEDLDFAIDVASKGYVFGCYIHQLLNGCDTTHLSIKNTVIDSETNEVLYQTFWP